MMAIQPTSTASNFWLCNQQADMFQNVSVVIGTVELNILHLVLKHRPVAAASPTVCTATVAVRSEPPRPLQSSVSPRSTVAKHIGRRVE